MTPEEEAYSVAGQEVPKTTTTSSSSTGLNPNKPLATGIVGDTITTQSASGGAGVETNDISLQGTNTPVPATAVNPAANDGILADPNAAPEAGSNNNAQGQGQGNGQLQQAHAIHYVTKIRNRFSTEPDTYRSFLKILHTYQKEQKGIKEVLEQVSSLFADHPDLLMEFTYFLPDAVQDQVRFDCIDCIVFCLHFLVYHLLVAVCWVPAIAAVTSTSSRTQANTSRAVGGSCTLCCLLHGVYLILLLLLFLPFILWSNSPFSVSCPFVTVAGERTT